MRKKFCVLILMIIIGGIFFTMQAPVQLDGYYSDKFYFLLSNYIISSILVLIYYSKTEIDVCSPDFWVIVPMFFTYAVGPITGIIIKNTTIEGFEVYDGCYYATMIYLISLVVFMLLFMVRGDRAQIEATYVDTDQEDFYQVNDSSMLVTICLIFTFIGIAVAYYGLMRRGLSLHYILSFGQQDISEGNSENIGGLINGLFFMYIPLLLLDYYMNNRILLLAIRVLAFIPLFVRGNRFFILMYVVPIVIMYYVKRNKRPRFSTILCAGIGFVLLLSGIQYVRPSMRLGSGYSSQFTDTFDFEYIWNSVQINLDMFKTLYGACDYFPYEHRYLFGSEMIFGTIFKVFPSFLRPNELISQSVSLRANFMGPNSNVWTYAQLTEYYFEFGILGCIFFMGLFARFCQRIRLLILKTDKKYIDYVLFAQMIPMIFQYVLRGQTSLNLWCMIFMLVPFWILRGMKIIK